jgi:hypothetical protein
MSLAFSPVADRSGERAPDLRGRDSTSTTNAQIFAGTDGGGATPSFWNPDASSDSGSFATDFNGDGNLDLVGLGSIALGDGARTFQAPVDFTVVNPPPGDGTSAPLIFQTSPNTSGPCSKPSFAAAVDLQVGSNPWSVAIGDFNGNGKADLAVANKGSGNVSILLGNGNGTFQATVNYSVGASPTSVAVGDFNGDGKADLAVANSGSMNVSILLGNGDGTFQTAVNYVVGSTPSSARAPEII